MSGVRYRAHLRDLGAELKRVGDDVETMVPIDVENISGSSCYYFADMLVPATTLQDFARQLLNRRLSMDAASVPFPPFIPSAGRVVGVRESPGRLVLDVVSEGRGVLVMSISNHRYWQAAMDGGAIALWPANLAYQAVILPAGRHRVELFYRNPLILPCMVLSVISFLIALSFIAGGFRSKSDASGVENEKDQA
jgi:hypothetical protein